MRCRLRFSPLLGFDRTIEVKVRRNGLLIVRADRCAPLVVVPLRLAAEIAAAAERGKGGGDG